MNKPSETHNPKGVSVEEFWRKLKDNTVKKDSGSNATNSRDLPEVNIEFCALRDSKDNWESRFDAWLDRL